MAGVNDTREHDLVVYGATGYVGALVAAHLAEHAPPDVRIALAGRSLDRLTAARRQLPPTAGEWPLLVADSDDVGVLDRLAASTRVLLTTVGPYAKYGLGVVGACARAGTHYADLTGEVLFVREAIDRFDGPARETGARIVHSCGYDSVPSDLAVFLLHERAAADGAGELTEVGLIATARGAFSGGTVDSMRGQFAATADDPAARRLAGDPYALSPDRASEPGTPQPADALPPGRRGSAGTWTTPFVMAGYNTRIVRRSNALQGFAYGRGLRYGEAMGIGTGPLAAVGAYGVTAGLAAFVAGFRTAPTRALLDRVLPKPGSGPSAETRAKGWFRMEVEAATTGGRRYRAVVAGSGDPGYAATALMLGESGLCLAFDALEERAGSLTPASAMGAALVERLRAAGHRYEVTPV